MAVEYWPCTSKAQPHHHIGIHSEAKCMVCGIPAVAQSRTLYRQGFAWCVDHLVEEVRLKEAHRIAREGHEPEVDVLVATIHDTYHHLQADDVEAAMEVIHQVAKRLPECSEMPSFVGAK